MAWSAVSVLRLEGATRSCSSGISVVGRPRYFKQGTCWTEQVHSQNIEPRTVFKCGVGQEYCVTDCTKLGEIGELFVVLRGKTHELMS